VNKKILVVEDTASILELEINLLRLLGYDPVGAASGMAAMKLLAQENPALALLDVTLPDMDGFKICQHIKNRPTTAHIPVFLVSAKTSSEDIARGEKAGADEYISKPFNTAEIAQLIESYLDRRN
jgi:DNA-binding response OmpR family regulator